MNTPHDQLSITTKLFSHIYIFQHQFTTAIYTKLPKSVPHVDSIRSTNNKSLLDTSHSNLTAITVRLIKYTIFLSESQNTVLQLAFRASSALARAEKLAF
jgi:hypothetical protein